MSGEPLGVDERAELAQLRAELAVLRAEVAAGRHGRWGRLGRWLGACVILLLAAVLGGVSSSPGTCAARCSTPTPTWRP
ncbi:hypothetical protein ACFQX7_15690 [Luedemannella flava]